MRVFFNIVPSELEGAKRPLYSGSLAPSYFKGTIYNV